MLAAIERHQRELYRVGNSYDFGSVGFQNDRMDRLTNCIYDYKHWDEALEELRRSLAGHPERDKLITYAAWRWYNWRASKCVEYAFCRHSRVEAEPEERHKLRDIFIDGVQFDVKVSRMPRGLSARSCPEWFVTCLFEGQSREGRYAMNNRIVVVPEGPDRKKWLGKTRLIDMMNGVDRFMVDYLPDNLILLRDDIKVGLIVV